MSRVSPNISALIHSLARMILNGVDLRVLIVWPVGTDGLVVALVCEVSVLEWPVGRWQLLLRSFLHIVLMRWDKLTSGNSRSSPYVSFSL